MHAPESVVIVLIGLKSIYISISIDTFRFEKNYDKSYERNGKRRFSAKRVDEYKGEDDFVGTKINQERGIIFVRNLL